MNGIIAELYFLRFSCGQHILLYIASENEQCPRGIKNISVVRKQKEKKKKNRPTCYAVEIPAEYTLETTNPSLMGRNKRTEQKNNNFAAKPPA